jgi:hypothetical protein
MAGPYDYTVNIPQPPAQNFLQSLMGIRQLQQMQEQSAIQQQQAAIQQQQAGFAQQMQPLQMQAEQERIKQIKAATGATDTSQQAAAYQLQQRKDLDAELLGISSDPTKFTADNIQRVAVKFHNVDPTLLVRAGEMRKNMPDQAKIFGDNTAKDLIITSVTGDSEAAIKQLDKRLEAANNTPELKSFVPQLEQLRDNFIKYPDQTVALAAVGQTFFAPDNAKAITDVLAKQADIKKTSAEAEEKTWQGALAKWKAQNAMKGELDPEEAIKRENSLRENFLAQPAVRGYQDKIESYDNVKNAKPTTPGDVAKMTAFIKLGDPRSTVSMGESGQLVASNIGEQAAKLVEQFNLNGGKLTPEMRKKIDAQADATMRSAKKSFENGVLAGFNRTAKAQKINPENVTGFLSPVSIPEEEDQGPTSEEQRIRGMLRPAAGFGNTMTPSQIPFQGSTFQGTPTDVDAILKQYLPR